MEFYMHVSNTVIEAALGSFGAAFGAEKFALWSKKRMLWSSNLLLWCKEEALYTLVLSQKLHSICIILKCKYFFLLLHFITVKLLASS